MVVPGRRLARNSVFRAEDRRLLSPQHGAPVLQLLSKGQGKHLSDQGGEPVRYRFARVDVVRKLRTDEQHGYGVVSDAERRPVVHDTAWSGRIYGIRVRSDEPGSLHTE